MRIIVVEDEATIREGICRQIEKTDPQYKVVGTAGRGGEGLELVREKKPDLVVTDVRMPEMDGITMIRKMREGGDQTRVIILSAYSEFEYAKQAIRLGVEEYLLKPVNILELKSALFRIDEQCRFERDRRSGAPGSLKDICTGLVIGTLKSDEMLCRALESGYGFASDTRFAVVCAYLGADYESARPGEVKRAGELLSRYPEVKGCVMEFARDKSVMLFIYGFDDPVLWKKRAASEIMRRRVSQGDNARAAFGWIDSRGPAALRPSVQTLTGAMDWNIVIKDAPMVVCPETPDIHTTPCPYPIELETRMKTALCYGDREKLSDSARRFLEYFHGESVYSPKEIKESCIRFIWAAVSTAKDISSMDKGELDMQRVLEETAEAVTLYELEQIIQRVVCAITASGKDGGTSLTVMRVLGMINEFYNTGITLNEIAGKLNLTPEYVGTQFKKEMGVSFSSYIRRRRMDKARELLLTSGLKLYEIAAAVGYTDAKYFSRQFKETVGQLPGDYKKTH